MCRWQGSCAEQDREWKRDKNRNESQPSLLTPTLACNLVLCAWLHGMTLYARDVTFLSFLWSRFVWLCPFLQACQLDQTRPYRSNKCLKTWVILTNFGHYKRENVIWRPRVLTNQAFTQCQTQNNLAHNAFLFVRFGKKFFFFEPATNSVCAWKLL